MKVEDEKFAALAPLGHRNVQLQGHGPRLYRFCFSVGVNDELQHISGLSHLPLPLPPIPLP